MTQSFMLSVLSWACIISFDSIEQIWMLFWSLDYYVDKILSHVVQSGARLLSKCFLLLWNLTLNTALNTIHKVSEKM